MILDKKSLHFAEFKGVLHEFIKNIEEGNYDHLEDALDDIPNTYGFDCFTWEHTAEGHSFWANLQDEYSDWIRRGAHPLPSKPDLEDIEFI